MKSISIVLGALALMCNAVDAFLGPAGLVTRAPSLSSTLITNGLAAGHGPGCCCASCARRSHGRSCSCPLCTSSTLSRQLHGSCCRCPACSGVSAMRMQAHGERCGCGECSSVRPAIYGSSCKCPLCVASIHSESCSCSLCAGGARRNMLTVMGMSSGHVPDTLPEAITTLQQSLGEAESITFDDTLHAIDQAFDYTPKRFVNGATSSVAGTNAGSCKVFSLGKSLDLSPADVLACFGEHYRSVLANPSGEDHANIRAFMQTGWGGIEFPDGLALTPKK